MKAQELCHLRSSIFGALIDATALTSETVFFFYLHNLAAAHVNILTVCYSYCVFFKKVNLKAEINNSFSFVDVYFGAVLRLFLEVSDGNAHEEFHHADRETF